MWHRQVLYAKWWHFTSAAPDTMTCSSRAVQAWVDMEALMEALNSSWQVRRSNWRMIATCKPSSAQQLNTSSSSCRCGVCMLQLEAPQVMARCQQGFFCHRTPSRVLFPQILGQVLLSVTLVAFAVGVLCTLDVELVFGLPRPEHFAEVVKAF